MLNKLNNAVAYCRYSKEDKRSAFLPEEQLSLIRDYALQNNYQIVKTFSDVGHSQIPFDRIGLRKMLDYLKDNLGKIKFLIITDITRFSACVSEIVPLKDFFKSKDIKILTLNSKEASKHIK